MSFSVIHRKMVTVSSQLMDEETYLHAGIIRDVIAIKEANETELSSLIICVHVTQHKDI